MILRLLYLRIPVVLLFFLSVFIVPRFALVKPIFYELLVGYTLIELLWSVYKNKSISLEVLVALMAILFCFVKYGQQISYYEGLPSVVPLNENGWTESMMFLSSQKVFHSYLLFFVSVIFFELLCKQSTLVQKAIVYLFLFVYSVNLFVGYYQALFDIEFFNQHDVFVSGLFEDMSSFGLTLLVASIVIYLCHKKSNFLSKYVFYFYFVSALILTYLIDQKVSFVCLFFFGSVLFLHFALKNNSIRYCFGISICLFLAVFHISLFLFEVPLYQKIYGWVLNDERALLNKLGVEFIKDAPFEGWGFSGFYNNFYHVSTENQFPFLFLDSIGNGFIQIWCDLGVIGFLLLLIFLFLPVILRFFRNGGSVIDKGLLFNIWFVVLLSFVTGIHFYGREFAVVFALLYVFSLKNESININLRKPISLCIIGITLASSGLLALPFSEDRVPDFQKVLKRDNLINDFGVYPMELSEDYPFRWVAGHAKFSISLSQLNQVGFIGVSKNNSSSKDPVELVINVNDEEFFRSQLHPGLHEIDLAGLHDLYENKEVQVEVLVSKTFRPISIRLGMDARVLGVKLVNWWKNES